MLHHVLLALCLLMHGATSQRSPFNRQQQQQQQRLPSPPAASGNDILTQVSDVSPDGSFYTKYETANGIAYEEQGQPDQRVAGSASWTTNEGERVAINWQADENGVVFQGDHLPTPPPVPALIQRALEWLAANPGKPDDEGQYREEEDGGNGRPAPPAAQLLSRRPSTPPRRF